MSLQQALQMSAMEASRQEVEVILFEPVIEGEGAEGGVSEDEEQTDAEVVRAEFRLGMPRDLVQMAVNQLERCCNRYGDDRSISSFGKACHQEDQRFAPS